MVASAVSGHLNRGSASDVPRYRWPAAIHDRLEGLWQRRDRERRSMPLWLRELYQSRSARTAAGVVGVLVGFGTLASSAATELRNSPTPTLVLAAAFPLMAVVYLLAWLLAGSAFDLRLRRWLRLTADPSDELERLSDSGCVDRARELADGLEARSIAWPMMALSLLAPLTIHLLIYGAHALFKGNANVLSSDDFSEWIALSGIIVGHAHLYLLVASWLFADNLRQSDPKALRRKGWIAYAITVGVAAVPGIVLLALPPLITAATGLLFIPAMFWWARRAVTRERGWLSRAA